MGDNYTTESVQNIITEAIEIRRQLHMYPELSFEEFKTSGLICNFLNNVGIEYKRAAKTGVVATIMSNEKYPTIAVRAEIDALPIQDEKTCGYASKNNGVSHACGHDGITAIVLGLAKILYKKRATLKCNVKFIFEPAEEIGKGAKALIQEGALKNPRVDRIIVFHLGNSAPLGMEIQRSVSTAEICSLNIKITGKSSHWGEYEKGVDAIYAAGRVICTINELNNTCKSKMPMVMGIGTISGGTKNNIVAETVEMKGTLRTFCMEDRNGLIQIIKEKLAVIEVETGAAIDVNMVPKIPSIYNDPELVQIGSAIGEGVFGADNVSISSTPFLAGDDAGFYFNEVRGIRIAFFAQRNNEVNYPLHNSRFDFNEKIIPLAIETLEGIIAELQHHI